MRNNTSSNGKELNVGDIVLYSTGTRMYMCVIRKITFKGNPPERSSDGRDYRRATRHYLEVIDPGDCWQYPVGHTFKAKAGERMWVVDKTMDEVLENLILQDSLGV